VNQPAPTDDLVMTERVTATPEQVFDYLVDPDKLARWMGNAAEVDPTPGGRFRVMFPGEDVALGNYVEIDRPNRVVFTWGWQNSTDVPPGSTTVTFTLTADGDETLIELCHAGLPLGPEDEHHTGWTYCFGRLAEVFGHQTAEVFGHQTEE
jgi:uncharacterized protein YndB with AHSA1/START domain